MLDLLTMEIETKLAPWRAVSYRNSAVSGLRSRLNVLHGALYTGRPVRSNPRRSLPAVDVGEWKTVSERLEGGAHNRQPPAIGLIVQADQQGVGSRG